MSILGHRETVILPCGFEAYRWSHRLPHGGTLAERKAVSRWLGSIFGRRSSTANRVRTRDRILGPRLDRMERLRPKRSFVPMANWRLNRPCQRMRDAALGHRSTKAAGYRIEGGER